MIEQTKNWSTAIHPSIMTTFEKGVIGRHADCDFYTWMGALYNNPNDYQRGLEDGRKDLELELLKRGKALYQLAFKNAIFIANEMVKIAKEYNLEIIEIHLKLDNWDCADTIFVLGIEDFLNDNIDFLYNSAKDLSKNINSENFHWDYSITYLSESMNKEKLVSDGFYPIYEQSDTSRPA